MFGVIIWVFILFWDLKIFFKLFGVEDMYIGDGIVWIGIIVYFNVILKFI